ncbi:MAG: DUF1127 domain-containing protein [Hyphomicrobiales bacterium]|nr:DUF1127 domain-containing protein [Hyphomicrobiales bacterium]MCY4049719.1 DUF1127 domain-containing protein [Hyphomicrobiales bacterium]MCY4053032.1 DUF1127 domain-containing protein [Hyphomicrobiales bacterium]
MSAHHYTARHFELPLGMYIAEKVYSLVKRGDVLVRAYNRWQENRAAASRLASLDEHLLRDIGIENRHLIGHYVRKGRC